MPRFYAPSTRYPLIYCHGAGGSGDTVFGDVNFMPTHCASGYPVACCNLGGVAWGSDAAITAFGNAVSFITGAPWSAKAGKVGIIGGSMGALVALNWARQNPTQVIAIALQVPALDLNDIYTNNKGGYQASIGTAYGVTYPTALPALATHSPVAYPADVASLPIKLYTSDDDPIASNTAAAQTWAAAVGANVVVQSTGANGHNVNAGFNYLDMVAFIDSKGGRA